MARPDYPMGFVNSALARGLTATQALNEAREAGLAVRTQSWYRLWGQAQFARDDAAAELQRPLHRRPHGDEIRTWTTRYQTGFAQQVRIYMRDRQTGLVIEKDYTLRSRDRLRSRRNAIRHAVEHYRSYADTYEMQVLGGLYTGTYQLQPE